MRCIVPPLEQVLTGPVNLTELVEAHSERLSAVVSLLPMGSSMLHENEVDGNPTPDDAPPTEF